MDISKTYRLSQNCITSAVDSGNYQWLRNIPATFKIEPSKTSEVFKLIGPIPFVLTEAMVEAVDV